MTDSMKIYPVATFGAGCFWGVEAAFAQVKGVVKTEAGYMGGDERAYPQPRYQQVCTDRTGYAEAVQVTFDPAVVSYKQLLKVFWKSHDPAQRNRQGADIGTQYRSVIFYHTVEQRKAAEESGKAWQQQFTRKIVTEIEQAGTFFRAEEYHQKYYEKHGGATCNVLPSQHAMCCLSDMPCAVFMRM